MLRYESAPDVLGTAPEHCPAHSARCDEFRDRTRAAAEEFVAGDPFVLNGVVAAHEMKDWLEVYVD